MKLTVALGVIYTSDFSRQILLDNATKCAAYLKAEDTGVC